MLSLPVVCVTGSLLLELRWQCALCYQMDMLPCEPKCSMFGDFQDGEDGPAKVSYGGRVDRTVIMHRSVRPRCKQTCLMPGRFLEVFMHRRVRRPLQVLNSIHPARSPSKNCTKPEKQQDTKKTDNLAVQLHRNQQSATGVAGTQHAIPACCMDAQVAADSAPCSKLTMWHNFSCPCPPGAP